MSNLRNQSIQREIEQGLRDKGGAFIGDPERPGLHVLDYAQGMQDFKDRAPWPENPSPSYELGRHRAGMEVEGKAQVMDAINERDRRSELAFREMLKDRPDLLEAYDRRMSELKTKKRARAEALTRS
jgi:hypothetical protein